MFWVHLIFIPSALIVQIYIFIISQNLLLVLYYKENSQTFKKLRYKKDAKTIWTTDVAYDIISKTI